MKSNKGFTLVELLAVIVILAVVMTMAVTAVGPLMARARKGALGEEGLNLVEAAKKAHQLEQMKATSKIKATSNVCFTLGYLNSNNYFEKGSSAGYYGSVYILYDSKTKAYTYKFWITNGTYYFDGMSDTAYDYEQAKDGSTQNNYCPNSLKVGDIICLKSKGKCAKVTKLGTGTAEPTIES